MTADDERAVNNGTPHRREWFEAGSDASQMVAVATEEPVAISRGTPARHVSRCRCSGARGAPAFVRSRISASDGSAGCGTQSNRPRGICWFG